MESVPQSRFFEARESVMIKFYSDATSGCHLDMSSGIRVLVKLVKSFFNFARIRVR